MQHHIHCMALPTGNISTPHIPPHIYHHPLQEDLSIANTTQRDLPHNCMINNLTTMYLTHTSYTSPSSDEGYPGLAGYTVTHTV